GGSGFGYPPSDNKVVLTAGAGTVEVAPVTASLMQLTVIVSFTATTGPVFVRTGGRDSSAMILEVVESQGRIIQNPVMVTDGEVTDNADIYVSQAAGLMKIQALGVGDVGATKFLVAPFGVEVSRGQRRQIVVLGLGIGAGQGSKATISGGGFTIDSMPILNGILVTLTVD